MLKEAHRSIMTSHINHLCKQYGLDKLYVSSIEAAGIWLDVKMLWVPKLEGPIAYYVALHEIGHFVTDEVSNKTLEREAFAWDWALEKGKIGATKSVYLKIVDCLSRYLRKEDTLDIPDNFKDLMSLAQNKTKVKK